MASAPAEFWSNSARVVEREHVGAKGRCPVRRPCRAPSPSQYRTDLLLSGPAGAGKSAAARCALEESGELAVAADFQSPYAARRFSRGDPMGATRSGMSGCFLSPST